MKNFWQDFKKFISRGNVIDMAIGVTVASAFTAIVTAFTKGFISPLLALVTGNSSLDTMTVILREAVLDVDGVTVLTPAVELLWGAFLQKIIDFLIIAFVLFLVMRIASGVMARSKKIRENLINAITDNDEKAREARELAEAEEVAKAEAEALAKAEAEALEAKKIADEEARKAEELALLKEIRDLLKKN